jgi:Flp pilus assembly protein TadD
LKLGRFEDCLKWFKRATELDPGHAEAHFQLGQALRRLGKMDEARAHLEMFRTLKARGASAPDRRSLR